MKHIFVVNPASGNGKNKKELIDRITAAAAEAALDYSLYITKHRGDGEAYVRSTASKGGRVRFYACGGDGTLNETVNGMAAYENAELTMIPAGRGNDFPRSFEHPDYFDNIHRQIRGKGRKIDLIRYNNRYCINMMNMGFDCAVVTNVEKWKNRPWMSGGLSYAISVGFTLLSLPMEEMTISLDNGESYDGKYLLVALGNGGWYGGGYHAAPRARLDDGLMEVNLIKPVSRLTFVKLVGDYKAGKIYENPGVKNRLIYRQCKSLTLAPKQNTCLCVDGELEPVKEVKLELQPKAVRFSVPKE